MKTTTTTHYCTSQERKVPIRDRDWQYMLHSLCSESSAERQYSTQRGPHILLQWNSNKMPGDVVGWHSQYLPLLILNLLCWSLMFRFCNIGFCVVEWVISSNKNNRTILFSAIVVVRVKPILSHNALSMAASNVVYSLSDITEILLDITDITGSAFLLIPFFHINVIFNFHQYI